MYGLAPEKLLRLVYEPFYLAISLTFYETIKLKWRNESKAGDAKWSREQLPGIGYQGSGDVEVMSSKF